MREVPDERRAAILNLAYLEGPEIYRFWCDDPDLEWDTSDLEVFHLAEAQDLQRELTLELEKLGRTVEVQHYFVPDICDDDKPGSDGKYRIEPIRRKLF